jgi:hypothetical protein
MKEFLLRRRLGFGVLMTSFPLGCVGTIAGQIHSHPTTQVVDIERAAQPVERGEGIIVHIDPATGEIMTPPTGIPPGQIAQPPAAAARQPLPELKPTLSPVPGGGVMIHIDDRFHTPLTATIDADGKVRFEHKTAGSGSDAEK